MARPTGRERTPMRSGDPALTDEPAAEIGDPLAAASGLLGGPTGDPIRPQRGPDAVGPPG
jgi:hypothetical protein